MNQKSYRPRLQAQSAVALAVTSLAFAITCFLPSTASAWVRLCSGSCKAAWDDGDTYTIDVDDTNFGSITGLGSTDQLYILVRSAVFAWSNAGAAIPRIDVAEDHTGEDAVVEADTGCPDGDCSSSTIAVEENPWGMSSDDCRITVFRGNATWSTIPGTGGFDLQAALTHEFGHCLGLNHSTNGDAVMFPTLGTEKRSLGFDDLTGARTVQGVASRPIYYGSVGGPWTREPASLNAVTGLGAAYHLVNGNYWRLLAFEKDNLSRLSVKGYEQGSSSTTLDCTLSFNSIQETVVGGASVSSDLSGYAVAYRNTNAGTTDNIRVARGIVPVASGCPTTATIQSPGAGFRSRMRPTVSFETNTSRLVMAWVDDNYNLKVSTSSTQAGNGSWTTPVTLLAEKTDAPVAMTCSWWTWESAHPYRCIITVPRLDAGHGVAVIEGYIDGTGNFVKTAYHSSDVAWFANVGVSSANHGASELRVFYSGGDANRNGYYLKMTCSSYTSCTFTNFSANAQTPVTPGYTQGIEEAWHAGF